MKSNFNNRGFIFTVVCVLLFFSVQTSGQDGQYDLTKLLNAALEHNPELKLSEQRTAQFDIDHRQAFYQFFPDLNIQMGNANNRGLFIDPSTNLLTRDFVYGTHAEINSEVLLFRGLYNHRYHTLTRRKADAARWIERTHQQRISRSVILDYYRIGLLLEDNEQRAFLLEELEQLNTFITGRVQSGLVHPRELKMLEAENADVQLQLINNRLEIEGLINSLRYLTGVYDLTIESLIPDSEFSNELDGTEGPNPVLAYHAAMMEVAEANLDLRKSAGMPVLSLEGALGTRTSSLNEDNYSNQLGDNNYQYIGVKLSIPVFRHFSYRSGKEKAMAGVEISRLQNEIAAHEYALELDEINRELELLEAKLNTLEIKESAYQSQFEYIVAQFRSGLVDILEINQISRLLNEAQTETIKTRIAIISAQLDLAFLQGRNLME